MRRQEEFYCDKGGGGCGKYFKTYLRSNMNGNFTIVCPSCTHEHYRVITDGLITGERHNNRNEVPEKIYCLKSTIRDTPWHDDPAFRRAQMRAYNGGIPG